MISIKNFSEPTHSCEEKVHRSRFICAKYHFAEQVVIDIEKTVIAIYQQKKAAPLTKKEEDQLWEIVDSICYFMLNRQQTSEQALLNILLSKEHPDVVLISLLLDRFPNLIDSQVIGTTFSPLYDALCNVNAPPALVTLLLKAGAKIPSDVCLGYKMIYVALRGRISPALLKSMLLTIEPSLRRQIMHYESLPHEPNLLKMAVFFNVSSEIWELLLQSAAPFEEHPIVRAEILMAALVDSNFDMNVFPSLYSFLTETATTDEKEKILNVQHQEDNTRPYLSGQTILHAAIVRRVSPDLLVQLLQDGARMEMQDDWGRTALHLAVVDPEADALIKIFLQQNECVPLINLQDNQGHTIFTNALHAEMSPHLIRKLQSLGGTFNASTIPRIREWNELHYAILRDADLETCKKILEELSPQEQAAMINEADNAGKGFTPFHYACDRAVSIEVIHYLLSKGALVEKQNHDGETALHCTALGNGKSNEKLYQLLLNSIQDPRKQADIINMENTKGERVLAILQGSSLPIISLFLDKGARPEDLGNQWSPLERALLAKASKKVIREILEGGFLLLNGEKSLHGWSLLHIAAFAHCTPEIIELLVSYGAKNIPDPRTGETPLHLVDPKAENAAHLYKAFLQGLSPQERQQVLHYPEKTRKKTVMHKALDQAASNEVIETLLCPGILMTFDRAGRNPFYYIQPSARGATERYAALLRTLTKQEKTRVLNEQNGKTQGTLLHWVTEHQGEPRLIELLLSSGAHRKIDVFKKTPLHYVNPSSPYAEEMLRALLTGYTQELQAAILNQRDHEGRTILFIAIQCGADISLIRYLLESGARPEIIAKNGESLLSQALFHPHSVEVCSLLLYYTKDPDSRKRIIFARDPFSNNTIFQMALLADEALHRLFLQFLDQKEKDEILNIKNNEQKSLLHLALEKKIPAHLIELFIKEGASPEALYTITTDGLTIRCSLLAVAASIDTPIETYQTLLFAIHPSKRSAFVNIPIQFGEEINPVLFHYIKHGTDPNILRLLIESGARVDQEGIIIVNGKRQSTPLFHYAASLTSPGISLLFWQLLLEALPKEKQNLLNQVDIYGNAILHLVSFKLNVALVPLLIQHGALPNLRNLRNDTPVDIAYNLCRYDVIEELVTNGADRGSLDLRMIKKLEIDLKEGWNQFTFACDSNQRVIECYFENKSAVNQDAVVIIQGKEDHPHAFSLYTNEQLDFRFEKFVHLSKHYRHTIMKVVGSTREASAFLKQEKAKYSISSLYLEQHGVGEDSEEKIQLQWDKQEFLVARDYQWIDSLKECMLPGSRIYVFSCSAAKEVREGMINPLQEMAIHLDKVAVFGSEKIFYATDYVLSPGEFTEMKFFSNNQSSTVLFLGQSRTLIS